MVYVVLCVYMYIYIHKETRNRCSTWSNEYAIVAGDARIPNRGYGSRCYTVIIYIMIIVDYGAGPVT